MIDGADSGVSPDLIANIRGLLDLVHEDCDNDNHPHYIIVTANNFELIKDYRCIWVSNLKEYTFDSKKLDSYNKWRNLYFDNKSKSSD